MEKSTKLFLWGIGFWLASGVSAILDGKYPIFNGFFDVWAWVFTFAAIVMLVMFAFALSDEY